MRRKAELERGVSLVGPHRDDLVLKLGPLPAKGYASHGESWSFALALRLAAYDLLRAETDAGGEPVLVLDDVFAELDGHRRERLAELVAGAEQVLVTAAVPGGRPRGAVRGAGRRDGRRGPAGAMTDERPARRQPRTRARRPGVPASRSPAEALASARGRGRAGAGWHPARAPAARRPAATTAAGAAGGSSPSSAAAPTRTTVTRSCSGPTLGPADRRARLGDRRRGRRRDGPVGRRSSGPRSPRTRVPLAFDDGELVVGADSTAWATQIRLLAPTLLARLAEELGAGVVTAVTVRGPSAPSWKKGLLAVRGRGPRDTYG